MEITKDEDQDEFEIPEKMYFINNFVIKITWGEHGQVNTGGDIHESGDHLIYFGRLGKSYGHGMVILFYRSKPKTPFLYIEFRSMDIIGDTLYMLNKKYKDLVFRVPLACSIEYKVINF